MQRKLAFEGIENFRDFGGYAGRDRHMKTGKLFRAANQAEASEADLAALAALNIAVIADLRRAGERDRMPSRRWNGFAAEVIDNAIGESDEDPWHVYLQGSDLSPASMRGYMVEYYRAAPYEARHIDLFSRWFQALAKTDGAMLVHCAAGKDRTGMVCAMTHHIAGVHDDDILADYMLTNDTERFSRRGPGFADHIEQLTGRRPSEETIHLAMGVEEVYLRTALDTINERSGDLDAYLKDVLGLDAGAREAIEDRILV